MLIFRVFQGLKTFLFASLFAGAIVMVAIPQALPPPAAAAQMVCVDRDTLKRTLADKHEEQPVAIGLASTGAVIEVYAAADGSTWTVVMTAATGVSCVVADGEAWITLAPEALGPGA